jgi:glycerol-3-phosphate acyltransferase PlsX
MKIAVDAMGGDEAPQAIVRGSVEAAQEILEAGGIDEILLVGREEDIWAQLQRYKHFEDLRISVVNAEEIITFKDPPAQSVKTKKNSSIVVCARLVGDGEAQALVSAGNTGAVMAACLRYIGRLKNVLRPAIAAMIPNLIGFSILLDVGANVSCKPKHLQQFAIMGDVYARYVLEKVNPRVGLLNIGEERSKGNELTIQAFDLIKGSVPNFVGNVEGRDIANGRVDVVVCDGFLGNVVLKFAESFSELVLKELKEELERNFFLKAGSFMLTPAFKKFRRRVDYSEYGGAPLLGINGACIICHGSSPPKAIRNAIRISEEFIAHDANSRIEENIELYGV